MLPACGISISMLLAVYLGIFLTISPSPITPGILRMAFPLFHIPLSVTHSGVLLGQAIQWQMLLKPSCSWHPYPHFCCREGTGLSKLVLPMAFLEQCIPHDTIGADWDCSLDATINIHDLYASPYCKFSSVTFWFCRLCLNSQVLSVFILWGT